MCYTLLWFGLIQVDRNLNKRAIKKGNDKKIVKDLPMYGVKSRMAYNILYKVNSEF